MANSEMARYVTAFAGRRDDYQLAIALAQSQRLDQFITTFYAAGLTGRMLRLAGRTDVGGRHHPDLPADRVRVRWWPELLQQFASRTALPSRTVWPMINRELSRAAARRAATTGASLLLYEPYALPAFTDRRLCENTKRVLFHFHPHPDLEREIYLRDREVTGQSWTSDDAGGQPSASASPSAKAWSHADLILCASSFTKRSLVHAGAEPGRCIVVPYGIDVFAKGNAPNATDHLMDKGVSGHHQTNHFCLLFVGTGIHRKGLHHLLRAWSLASPTSPAKLILVCRHVHRDLESMIQRTPNVQLVRGTSRRHLGELYRSATASVLPSLVEGFGYVLLESLAAGCPVVATDHTAAPDLGGPGDGVFVVDVGNAESLAKMIDQLSQDRGRQSQWSAAARRTAERFTWSRFRSQVAEQLGRLESC